MKKLAIVGDVHYDSASPRSRIDDYPASILEKLRWIGDQADVIVLLGDNFHRAVLPLKSFSDFLGVFLEMAVKGKRILTLLGNHDYGCRNLDTLDSTAYGLMTKVGMWERIDRVQIEGWELVGMDHLLGREMKPAKQSNSILLAHYFYKNGFSPEESLSVEDIMTMGHTINILGHDHIVYDEEKIGSQVILRPGSLGRNTSHDYQTYRLPSYYEVVIDGDQIRWERKVVEIAKPANEVFNPQVYLGKGSELAKELRNNLNQLVDCFKKTARKDSEWSVHKILKDLGAPESVIEILRQKHEAMGKNFR